ncbi:hypothetical protein SANTM175S_09083 [Streptomyces antimycoticus]
MGGVPIAVQQDDGGAAEAVAVGGAQRLGGGVEVQGADDLAVSVHPLGDLHHPVIQRLGEQDPAVEEAGPVLVRDAQGVPEAFGDDEDGRLALALQQGVGGDRGAHLDDVDPVGRDRFTGAEPQRLPDPGDSGVGIALGVVGEQLAGDQAAVRTLADDVREGSAPVDPEFPATRHPAIVAAGGGVSAMSGAPGGWDSGVVGTGCGAADEGVGRSVSGPVGG